MNFVTYRTSNNIQIILNNGDYMARMLFYDLFVSRNKITLKMCII